MVCTYNQQYEIQIWPQYLSFKYSTHLLSLLNKQFKFWHYFGCKNRLRLMEWLGGFWPIPLRGLGCFCARVPGLTKVVFTWEMVDTISIFSKSNDDSPNSSSIPVLPRGYNFSFVSLVTSWWESSCCQAKVQSNSNSQTTGLEVTLNCKRPPHPPPIMHNSQTSSRTLYSNET